MSLYIRDWLLRNTSQGHSENTDEIAHQECQIGRMDYERGEVGFDSLPGLHFIFIGILFCTRVELMFPPPDRIVKILSSSCQLESFVRQGNS
jgi:hypothetical protein